MFEACLAWVSVFCSRWGVQEKLEADEALWRWQQRERSAELERQREEAAEVARVQLQQLEEIGRTLEEKLNELSMRALTQQLQSLLASSKALRLQGQIEGPLTPAAGGAPTNGANTTKGSAGTSSAAAPSSPLPAPGALAGAPGVADVTSGSAPSQS